MMYRLSITNQPAQIGVNIQRAPLDIKASLGQIQIETEPGQLEVKRAPRPVVQIDQSVCRASVGIRSCVEFAKYEADKGMQQSLEGAGRRASEGRYLANIPYSRVEDLAKKRAEETREFGNASVPTPPKMSFEYQPLDLKYWPTKVSVSYIPAEFHNNTQRTSVEIYLRQINSLKIDWIGQNYDRTA